MNRRTESILFNNGNTILFVIAALLVTGFISSAMLRMAFGDTVNPKLYFSSASARSMAKSGMISAINYFESEDSETKEKIQNLLRNWISSPTNSPQWIIGDNTHYFDIAENKDVPKGNSSNPRFNVELVAFDERNHNITLRSHGIGNNGSRATMTNIYHLQGLEYDRDPGNIPQNALQAENGNYEFNCKFTVNGDVAFAEGLKLNVGPFEFNGTFRLDPHRSNGKIGKTVINTSGVFKKRFYSAGEVEMADVNTSKKNVGLTFMENAGFDKRFKYTGNPVMLGDTLFLNGGATQDGTVLTDLNGTYLWANKSSAYNNSNANNITLNKLFTNHLGGHAERITDLPKRLGFKSRPHEITFNCQLPLSHPYVVTVPNKTTIDEEWLNNQYDAQLKNKKLFNNKFLVVRFDSAYETDGNNKLITKSTNGTKFRGKAIIIVESAHFETISMETTPDANVGLYIKKYVKQANTIKDLTFFRGFIYVEEVKEDEIIDGKIIEYFANFFADGSKTTTYKGAIYASTKAKTKFDGHGEQIITWDQDAINELAKAGIFSSNTSTTTLVYSGNNLSAQLLSQNM